MILVGEDYFVPVMQPVRVQIVRVEDCHVDEFLSCAFFRDLLEREPSCELGDAQGLLSSSGNWSRFLGPASSYPDSDDYDSLFGSVSEPSCPIEPCWIGDSLDDWFFSPADDGEA